MTTVPDASVLSAWRKSSHSNNGDGACVEVVDGHPVGVPVRDSKVPYGPALVFAPDRWSTFVAAVKDGDLTG
ncbi:DUF397 domain-containing protein [Streptomyces zingiberis]|uniref:DUF397 domain-containing protein n=1 Tax=Streptomyces zingiberis TaxID=2053010 RepID=A0ABX1BVP2_9ACTN|nr:DUF397 domain-containing protein [Streptomyces zingiberis]NJP99456.1 DUF397 domain-containing protein [Streptomyces zingiberis]